MLDDAACLSELRNFILAPELDVTLNENNTLVGKIPGGELRFLHKLFMPTKDIVQQIELVLRFPVPKSYSRFFSFSDGATLYDDALVVYGMGGPFSREIEAASLRPINLADQVGIQRQIDPGRHWIEVGGIAAATETYSLQLAPSGATALCSREGRRREYPSFLPMVVALSQILDQNCNRNGLIDPTAETLQLEIDEFISRERQ